MFLLKKVFQLRDKANPELEKPFLEHLEDLRVMITRVVITLLVSMVACFTFQDELMAILRKPVDDVWLKHEISLLPDNFDAKSWELSKKVERAATSLEPELAQHYLAQFGPEVHKMVGMVRMLRAVSLLPEEKRADFLKFAKAETPVADTVLVLLSKGASPEIDQRGNLQMMSTLKPTEGFMLSMKLAFFAGIVLAFPLLLLFILQFVLPGLHQHERKVLWPALAIGFGLFLFGVAFAYFLVLPEALQFFHEWSLKLGVANDWRIGEYITFATQFTLLFGLSFELPVVIMVLVKIGLLSYETMSRTRSHAIVAIFVAAAIITPTPDAMTLCLMALPMIALYEGCIWLAYFDNRKRQREEDAEERERMERLLAAPDEPESGEQEDRSDHWDPSDSEEAWKESTVGEDDDTPPQSIPDEEKRRMTDLSGEPAKDDTPDDKGPVS